MRNNQEKSGHDGIFECSPFTSLDKVYEYFKSEEIDADSLRERAKTEDIDFWYVLEKWVLNTDTNDMEEGFFYTFINGELCYFYDNQIDCKKRNIYEKSQPFSTYTFFTLNLPVPYQVGDVLEFAATPFTPRTSAIIIDWGGGNRWDCCLPVCLWLKKDGKFDYGSLKHAHFFHLYTSNAISPLYLTKRVECDKIENTTFSTLNKHLNGDIKKGNALWDFLHKNGTQKESELLEYIKRAASDG